MVRNSSSSRRSSSRPSYSYSSPKSPISMPQSKITTPSITSQPSIVTHNHQVEKSGFFSNMWTGFGLGAGQSIAANIFRSDSVVKHVHDNSTHPITNTITSIDSYLPKEFVQCMKDNNNDKELCKQFLE